MRECIVDQCKEAGCPRIIQMPWEPTGALVPVCSTYGYPKSWWRRGTCPFVFKHKEEPNLRRVRVGQQKQKRKK